MAVTDANGLPIAISTGSASRHEVKLVEQTLDYNFAPEQPQLLIGDKAYDSNKLRDQMTDRNIEMVVPHRRNRKQKKRQDGRKLRRYKRRWKVERFFAWLHNYRRCVVRYDRYCCNFEGFVLLATIAIYLKKYF